TDREQQIARILQNRTEEAFHRSERISHGLSPRRTSFPRCGRTFLSEARIRYLVAPTRHPGRDVTAEVSSFSTVDAMGSQLRPSLAVCQGHSSGMVRLRPIH